MRNHPEVLCKQAKVALDSLSFGGFDFGVIHSSVNHQLGNMSSALTEPKWQFKITRYLCFKIRPLLHVSLNNFVARTSFKNLRGIFDQVAKDAKSDLWNSKKKVTLEVTLKM